MAFDEVVGDPFLDSAELPLGLRTYEVLEFYVTKPDQLIREPHAGSEIRTEIAYVGLAKISHYGDIGKGDGTR
jgi:hypothetical protein